MPNPVPSRVCVFDSSALLAVLLGERGGDLVIPILEGGLLSTVNLVEVHTRMVSLGAAAPHAWDSILNFQCEICPLSETQARIAAELVTATRPFGLSLGDRACLALAIERNAKVYTTDRAWKNLNLGIELEVIR
ncbi:MAG: type II toxin-antitoxin system VapC family toxin [Terracidiphilus sp.]